MTIHSFILDTGFTCLTPDEAKNLAAQSNSDLEDDWTYEVQHDSEISRLKNSWVAVFDEDQNFLGNI